MLWQGYLVSNALSSQKTCFHFYINLAKFLNQLLSYNILQKIIILLKKMKQKYNN